MVIESHKAFIFSRNETELNKIITDDETWLPFNDPEENNHPVEGNQLIYQLRKSERFPVQLSNYCPLLFISRQAFKSLRHFPTLLRPIRC